MTPVLRVATLGAGATCFVLFGAGVAYYLGHRTPDLRATGSQVASAPHAPTSLPGDRMLPDAEGAYDRSERQNRAAAEQKAGPAASVPHMDALEPTQTLAPDPNPAEVADWQRRQGEVEREQKKREQAREKERQEAIQRRAQRMGKVLAGWGGIHETVEASLKPPEPEKPDAGRVARYDPLANLPVDRLYWGLLRVFISSDEPGPVAVTIKDGELDGARLIGRFERADEKVVIHFDRMTFKGAWYAVDAVAINPENGRLGLATDVDRRTFTRWAALLGSAILQGAQRAYLSQGTQSNYLWGQTTTREFDDREILGIALGEIGTRTRQTATEYFDRPPTVYVDPAIQLVGVLFLAPPSRKTRGEAPPVVALDPSQLQSTARNEALSRAATAAMTAPAHAIADPSGTAQNRARPPVTPALAPPALPPADDAE